LVTTVATRIKSAKRTKGRVWQIFSQKANSNAGSLVVESSRSEEKRRVGNQE